MSGSEYTKRQDGDAFVFEVTPAQSPKFIMIAVGGVVLGLIGLVMGPVGWIIFLPIGAWAIWFGYYKDIRPAAHRLPSNFRVSQNAVESSGRTFAKNDIHRLIIKNGVNNEVLGNPSVVIPVNTSTAMGVAHRGKVAAVANALELETGGRSYFLAGGMDSTTAFGLLHDVSKVMGLAIQ
jgi:hypothetical protein